MATVYVQEDGGGDYTTLAAAVAANEIDIEIQKTWNNAETGNITIDDAGTVIECTGDARHPGYVGGSPSHWRHRVTSGHAFTLEADVTFIGVDIGNQSTGVSDEICRVDGEGVDLIVRDSLLWFDSRNSEQDIIYVNDRNGITITLENCIGWNAYRAVLDIYDSEGTFNVNSCHFYDIGYDDSSSSRSGLFGVKSDHVPYVTVCNAFNTCIHINTGYVAVTADTGINTINLDRCISNVSDWAEGFDTENVTDCSSSHTWADSDQGEGNYVIVVDITGVSPFDLRIQDLGNTKNEAQDMHADGSGANLTMPAQDIVDTARPQNTNYDCGAFELAAGGETYELSASISGASGTGSPGMNVLRAVLASISTGSAVPDAVILKLLKALDVSIVPLSGTSDTISLEILRALNANITGASAMPDDVALKLLRAITASIQGASDTSAATLAVLRAVSVAISAQSQTPDDVDLLIAGILTFSAAISAASAVSDGVVCEVLREISSAVAAESTTTDEVDLAVLRKLSSSIAAGTATPDDVALFLLKALTASILPGTDTATVALGILREITAAIAAGTTIQNAVLSVMREATATITPETLTSAITLITGGMGIIIDATIESLTTKRTILSLTAEREFESLTPERTIEKT